MAALLVACVLCAPVAGQLAPQRVEGLAAVVGGYHPGPGVDMLLRSDVELRARLHLATGGRPHDVPGPALLQAALSELVGEVLIAREAERVQVGTLRAADVQRERARIAKQVGGEAALVDLLGEVGATTAEIDAMARRRAQVALFLNANLEGVHEVTGAAVDAALSAEGADPRAVSEEHREAVRTELSHAALLRGVERWVRVLKARSVVRVWADFGEE